VPLARGLTVVVLSASAALFANRSSALKESLSFAIAQSSKAACNSRGINCLNRVADQ